MAGLAPFRALRPSPSTAARVAAVPYDVVNTDEARALADGNPLSFLHVSRAEIDLPPGTDLHGDDVYARGGEEFRALKASAPLVAEETRASTSIGCGWEDPRRTGGCALPSDEYDRESSRTRAHTARQGRRPDQAYAGAAGPDGAGLPDVSARPAIDGLVRANHDRGRSSISRPLTACSTRSGCRVGRRASARRGVRCGARAVHR